MESKSIASNTRARHSHYLFVRRNQSLQIPAAVALYRSMKLLCGAPFGPLDLDPSQDPLQRLARLRTSFRQYTAGMWQVSRRLHRAAIGKEDAGIQAPLGSIQHCLRKSQVLSCRCSRGRASRDRALPFASSSPRLLNYTGCLVGDHRSCGEGTASSCHVSM